MILVIGATGSVGSEVLTQLIDAGEPVRASVSSSKSIAGYGGETVRCDFGDPATFGPALDGVDRLFLMRPPAISDVKRFMRPFIEQAAHVGVAHTVFMSVMGVNRVMPHWQVERDIEAAALSHTFLRPAFFTQNLSNAYRDDIAVHNRIRLPAGNGRTSFIDVRDVATVAVLALRTPAAHHGKAYTLTGDNNWSYNEVADLLTTCLGRRITYDRVSFLRYRRELRLAGLPTDYVRVQLLINAVARLGLAGHITETFAELVGRAPMALAESLNDLRSAWAR